MISRQIIAVFALAVLLCPDLGQADDSRPSTYDECITESMQGVGSDVAARAIITSCRNQFPELAATAIPQAEVAPQQAEVAPQQAEVAPQQAGVTAQQAEISSGTGRSLTPEELRLLSATALVMAGSYRLTFRNGNEHLTITEVTIAVWEKSNPDGIRKYTERVRIEPLASGTAKYTVDYKGSGFDYASSYEFDTTWNVAAAKGTE